MLAIGTRLGHYTIAGRLGAGGRGEVYRAVDERDGSEVAVKVLPEPFADDRTARGRFKREIAALAAVSHPNVLRILDYGNEEGLTYAVVELLDGESLADRVERGAVGWREAATLGARIADGLAAAHDRGVVHRDLKPANVFVTSDGGVKVLDFGFARLDQGMSSDFMDSLPVKTDPGVMLGTVPYMSPEQICALTIDARTDLWSLGCVLYETVSGRAIFRRRTMVATMSSILKEPAPRLADLGVEAPEACEAVLRRLVEKDQNRRFETAAAAAAALRAV